MSVFAVPFIYLLTRLYTKRDKPWGTLSGLFFVIYLFCTFSVLIAWPGLFHNLPLKSAVGAQAMNLKQVRDSLSRYIEANGTVPPDLSSALSVIPVIKIPLTPHKASSEVRVSTFADIRDTGQWLYIADSSAPVILIDCTHTDHEGNHWSSY
ncbi:MAG: hypothetical protein A2234_06890 [Elusimicrobia bacterium RIFOXYA2_FULL_58_8]|nr:MAG: hypothetical protein A2285_00405 [Elusimicrobia bacterium RIFOXYA12_FULL_57_11]OGS16686.1 MAG: hypothetical protein A2234_06890 [Elusimicrobia bacterium RIFOXYA2_FULL_58_8]